MKSEKIGETLGYNMKMMRVRKNMTQSVLAEAAGCSTVFISEIEKASKRPSVEMLLNIADALDCTLNDLCYGNRPQTNAELYLVQKCRNLTEDDIYMLAAFADAVTGRRIKEEIKEQEGRKSYDNGRATSSEWKKI